jgi:hypothetical protein
MDALTLPPSLPCHPVLRQPLVGVVTSWILELLRSDDVIVCQSERARLRLAAGTLYV